jgi:hypothetical protein
VPIERLVLSGSGLRLELGPDCPLLRDGFHADETSHRWTNGKAAVPAELLAHFTGKIAIDLQAGAIDLCYPILAIEEPVIAAAARIRRVPTASRRGSKREELLRVIRDGNGLSRGEILEKTGLKSNKSGEMSVSNALTALTKSGQVTWQDGKYAVA